MTNTSTNFEEIKRNIQETQRQINLSRTKLQNIDKQVMQLEKERSSIQERFEHAASMKANKELCDYTNNLSEPFAKKVSSLEEQLISLDNSHDEKMKKFDEEDLTDYYYSEAEMLEDVQKTLAMLNERLIDLLGERFQKELDSQLNSVTFEIQEENLEEICDYFTKLSEYFEKINNKNSKFASIETIVKKLNTVGSILETGNKQLTFIVLLVLCFVFYFAFKFIFPFYIIALAVLAVYNIKISNKVYSASVLRKVIQDNISKIEQMYHDKALAQLNQERDEVEAEYQNTKAHLEEELQDSKNSLESVLMSAKERFRFDDNQLQEDRDNLLCVNSNKKMNLENEKLKERDRLNLLTKQYTAYREQYNQATNTLKDSYLNPERISDSIEMDPDFLVNIDSTTKSPKFFKFNFGSSLFLYEDPTDVSDFIRLFITQVRIKLRASCVNMAVFDDVFMCQNYLGFTDAADTKNENVLKTILNKDELKSYIGELSDLSIVRTTNIKREFNNIVEYNQFMLSQGSMPEAYKFFFVQDVDLSILLETKFKQLLINGGDLGIYILIFLKLEKFSQARDNARDLVKYFDSIYTFEIDNHHKYEGSNTVIQTKARDFVLERIIE